MIEAVTHFRGVCDGCGREVPRGAPKVDEATVVRHLERAEAVVLPRSIQRTKGVASLVACGVCVREFHSGVVGRGLAEVVASDTPVGARVREQLTDWLLDRIAARDRMEDLCSDAVVVTRRGVFRGARAFDEDAGAVDPREALEHDWGPDGLAAHCHTCGADEASSFAGGPCTGMP